MSETTMHPDDMLNALIEKGVRSDKEKKLRGLHHLCAEQYKRPKAARDFSLSGIAHLAEQKGLFKFRSIYNALNKDYRALVNAWASYSGPVVKVDRPQVPKGQAKYEDLLLKIPDPAVRASCQLAFVQRDNYKHQLDMLKSVQNTTIRIGSGASQVIEPAAQLTDSERNALTQAISPDELRRNGWIEGRAGAIVDGNGDFVFNPGFGTAIRRILGIVESSAKVTKRLDKK